MNKNSTQKTKNIKRACQIVAIHVVLLTVLFSNEPLRVEGPHAVLYDTLAKSLLDVRFTYGLFAKPRAENTRVTFLAKYASGKSVEWSPVDLENTPLLEKGHEAIMRNWLDENIGDYGAKTNKLLMRDATKYAARELAKPGDEISQVELYKTVESIPAPGSTEEPKIIERTMLYTMSPKQGAGNDSRSDGSMSLHGNAAVSSHDENSIAPSETAGSVPSGGGPVPSPQSPQGSE